MFWFVCFFLVPRIGFVFSENLSVAQFTKTSHPMDAVCVVVHRDVSSSSVLWDSLNENEVFQEFHQERSDFLSEFKKIYFDFFGCDSHTRFSLDVEPNVIWHDYNHSAGVENNIIAQWKLKHGIEVYPHEDCQSILLCFSVLFTPIVSYEVCEYVFIKYLFALNLRKQNLRIKCVPYVLNPSDDGMSCSMMISVDNCRGILV